jgi:hypothetical protein
MAKADNDSCGRQQHARLGGGLRQGRKRVGGKRRQRQQSGNYGCGGGTWQRRTTMVAVGDDGDGGRWQRQTTKAADDDGMQGRAADYKGEGGGRAANNNGIRPAEQRVWNKYKQIEFTRKDFFQQYGLSGWSFFSCRKQTLFLLDLSLLFFQALSGLNIWFSLSIFSRHKFSSRWKNTFHLDWGTF